LSRITSKKAPTRCTTCKRSSRIAITEQSAKNVQCDVSACDFHSEIKEAIEAKYRLSITPKEKKNLNVIEKEKTKIQIVRKK
jgi:hypothetical protein